MLILIAGGLLKKKEWALHNAVVSANVDIVHAAVPSSEHVHINVIGENTDLFILLFYYANDNGINYCSDIWISTPNPIYDILSIQSLLGRDNYNMLLFLYAFIGHTKSTTSRIFSNGKPSVF